MRRIVLSVTSLLLFLSTFAVEDYNKYLYNKLSSYGRWSTCLEIGLSRFDGDFSSTRQFFDFNDATIAGFLSSPNMGFNLEYSLHPNFGVGLNVSGLYMKKSNLLGTETVEFGSAYTNPYVTFDILSAFRGVKSPLVSIWGNVGLGFGGLILPKANDAAPVIGAPQVDYPQLDVKGTVFSEVFMIIPLTLSMEFSMSKKVSIGANIRFVVTNTDYLETIYRQNFVDYWQTVDILWRYKFVTKDKKHFRDELFNYQDPNTMIITQLQSDIAALNDRLDGIEDKLDTLDNRMDKLEGIMTVNGPDSDGDGVPDVRDLEPNSTKGNLVDFWGKSTKISPKMQAQPVPVNTVSASKEVFASAVKSPDDFLEVVFFDFDKTDLDKQAQVAIYKVANKMKKDMSLLVEVRGYADNPGGNDYNQRLSQRRSEKVKNELINIHGIAANRIIANGKGKIPYPPGKVQFNRRCDFYFNK